MSARLKMVRGTLRFRGHEGPSNDYVISPSALSRSEPNAIAAHSYEQLAGDVDTAIRNSYGLLRLVLHKLEGPNMDTIRQPDANPFGTVHDQTYERFP